MSEYQFSRQGNTPSDPVDGGEDTKKELASVKEMMAGFKAQLETMSDMFKSVAQKPQAPQPQPQPQASKREIEIPALPENIEMLSRQELIDVVTRRTVALMQRDVIGPLKDELHSFREVSGKEAAQMRIKEMQRTHKDFDEWVPEIQEIIQTKGLSLEDAYKLARVDNPEKVKTIETREREAAEKAAAESGQKPEQGGTPGSFSQRPSGGYPEKSGSMDPDEAAKYNYEQFSSEIAKALQEMED